LERQEAGQALRSGRLPTRQDAWNDAEWDPLPIGSTLGLRAAAWRAVRSLPMVQFNLPKGSRISAGKTWPRPDSQSLREFRIYRWNPDDGRGPRIDTFFVDTGDCGPMVSTP